MNFEEQLNNRLVGAKFRLLNEKMYSNCFDSRYINKYYEYFRKQCSKWPHKPLDVILPMLEGCNVVFDIGCGEAELSRRISGVKSYDIFPIHSWIIKCDMRHIPEKDKCANCVVYCLSLMSGNVADIISEGRRVLKRGGKMVIAEVSSRIPSISKFVHGIEGVGFRRVSIVDKKYFVVLCFKKTNTKGISRGVKKIELRSWTYKKR